MDLKNKYLLNLTDSKIEKKQLDSGIYAIVKMANKELNKNYTGKYKFSVSNGNKDINELKLSPKKKREIKKL